MMAGYDYGDARNRIKAKRLLKELLLKARARADELGSDVSVQSETAVARGLFDHLGEDKLDGVHVYRGPKGGWHADLSLRDVPLGLPRVIGTPSALPCATRDEAMDAALNMVAMVVVKPPIEHLGPRVEDGSIAFELDDAVLSLPRELIEGLRDALGTPPPGYAAKRLSEISGELPGNGPFTNDRVRTFDAQQLARLHSVVAMAIVDGYFRWPPREHHPPVDRTRRN